MGGGGGGGGGGELVYTCAPVEYSTTHLYTSLSRGGASEASVATLTDCSAGNFDGTCVKPRGYALEVRAMQITLEATRMRRKFAAALQFEKLQSL